MCVHYGMEGDGDMPDLEVIYFDYAGRAEALRVVLTLGGITFKDTRVSMPDFVAMRDKLAYKSLPVMKINGVAHAQSCALLRYCGKLSGMYPDGLLRAARVDEVVETIMEFVEGIESVRTDVSDSEYVKNVGGVLDESVPRLIGGLEKRLEMFEEERVLEGGGGGRFVLGDEISVADVAVYVCWLNVAAGAWSGFEMERLYGYDRLCAVADAVRGDENVREWNELMAAETERVRTRVDADDDSEEGEEREEEEDEDA